ncbi:polysulfide reductase NrfD [bacterium]|nr:polysulfide reductase NrfD [bacterium]
MNFGFIIDNRKCIGCHACTVACKAEHDVPIGVNRTWVKYIEKGDFPNTRRIFSVMRCNHCADAPCVEICPVSALFTRADGIVDFDHRRCIGCKACTQACPYDALYIDPESHTAAKCNYCAHRVDIGLQPACVNVCPEHAIISGDLDDPCSEIAELLAREQVTARKTEKGTQPKLFYIEGDEAALNPSAAEFADDYMWSTQSAGVGHFAKYAASRRSQSDPQAMTQQLSQTATGESGGHRPPHANHEDGKHDKNSVHQEAGSSWERNRKVYDAPDKGVVWGWEVSAYVWTKGIAAGAFLIPFIGSVFGFLSNNQSMEWTGILVGFAFLMVTGGLLVIDLDQPKRFAYVMLRPHWDSWLVRGAYAIALYGLCLTLIVLAKYFDWTVLEKVCWWLGAALAILTAVYTAFLFAQAKGRDFWQSPTMPLHMLIHALLAGAAILGLTALFSDSSSGLEFVRAVLQIGLIVNLFVLASELLTAHSTQDSKKTVRMIVSGPFRMSFWIGSILGGNIIPLILLGFAGLGLVSLAGVLVLIGILITEHIWVRAPQLIPLS